MKLSGMKLSDAQNATDRVDASGTLIRLAMIGMLPFVLCLRHLARHTGTFL